jgi:hypothetical protein
MSGEQPHRERGPFVGCLASVLMLAPPLYLLSVGPFVWLCDHGYLSPGWIQVVQLPYFPIAWLRDHNETFHRVLDWYLSLWQ